LKDFVKFTSVEENQDVYLSDPDDIALMFNSKYIHVIISAKRNEVAMLFKLQWVGE
jgi:hypothetical protein